MRLAAFLLALPLMAATTTIDCGSATDSNFTGGTPWLIPVAVLPSGSTDATLRYDASATGFSYRVPVVDGLPYIVTLRFIEPSVQVRGQRVFSVSINNLTVLDRMDLVAEAGFLKPLARSVLAVGSDGALVIKFITQVRSAMVSAIEITPLFMMAPPPDPTE